MRVLAHLHPLLGRELPRLAEDLVGDGDLADVVHGAGDADQLGPRRPHPRALGQELARAAHAVEVGAGGGVTKLDGLGQSADGLLLRRPQGGLGARQLLDGGHEVFGALRDQELEVLAVRAVLDLELTASQGVVGGDEQFVGLEGLDDVAVGAELGGRRRGLGIVVPAHHEHGDVGVAGAQIADEPEP